MHSSGMVLLMESMMLVGNPHEYRTEKDESLQFYDVIRFHGHSCPGVAIGFRMARAAMHTLGVTRSDDEELVAVVENDSCGADALQYVTGCTFGKGNLVFHDYGKHAFSLFSRVKQQGVRVVFHGSGLPAELRSDRIAYAERIITENDDALLSQTLIAYEEFQTARIRNSVVCNECREAVMDSRVHEINGRTVCIPCSKKR